MGSVRVSSCRCMYVSCVHRVTMLVLHDFQFVNDGQG